MQANVCSAFEQGKKKLLRIVIQPEFPREKPEDSFQDVTIMNCAWEVPVLLYRTEKSPAVLENNDAPKHWWAGKRFPDVTAAGQHHANAVR